MEEIMAKMTVENFSLSSEINGINRGKNDC